MSARLALIGARGHVGRELLELVAGHPELELVVACSGSAAGEPVPGHPLRFSAPDPALMQGADVVVLALPNHASDAWVRAADPAQVLLDLSADHRFDEAWVYGLPERARDPLRGARRIANPGCYATAAQIALGPVAAMLEGEPVVFGVSGVSGAGSAPTPRNDPAVLKDNVLPYALQGHVHEREIGHHLGRRVRFHPHVAPWFRGISATVSFTVTQPTTSEALMARYRDAYADEPLVTVSEEAPRAAEAAGRDGAFVGGLQVDGTRVVVVATLDNLRKGAATQAIQNLNLALGCDELSGLSR